jgi:hypothetical protein
VRKIRGFRLALHARELRRRLRRAADLPGLGLDDESLFEKHLKGFGARLEPSVVFESFGADSTDTAALSPLPGLAHTIGLVTLGPDADAYLAEQRESGARHAKLAECLRKVALEEGVRFVIGLIAEEVEDERCDLSPIHYVLDPDALAFLLEKLSAAKIRVELSSGTLRPECSAAFCLSWIARPRGRRSAKADPAKKK